MKYNLNRNIGLPTFHLFKKKNNLPTSINNYTSIIDNHYNYLVKLQNAKRYTSKEIFSSIIPEINKKKTHKKGNYGIEKSISQKNFPNIINEKKRNIINKNINEHYYKRSKSLIDIFKNEDSEEYRKFIRENNEFYNQKIKPNKILLKKYNHIKSKIQLFHKKNPLLLYSSPSYIEFELLKQINK